jgi:hypothetical protein
MSTTLMSIFISVKRLSCVQQQNSVFVMRKETRDAYGDDEQEWHAVGRSHIYACAEHWTVDSSGIVGGTVPVARAVHGVPADMVAMANASIGEGLRGFIGIAEILAAIGLILPSLTRILPSLTALAAAGLMIVLSSATVLHLSRGETSSAISAA